MKRNAKSYFSNIPTPSLPRNRFDRGVVVDLTTLKHGRLQLINAKFIYPDMTLDRYASELVQADTYNKFPMDQVELDTYEFFVPLRIIDKDFEKVFGDVEPYDDNVYTFPDFELDFSSTNYLNHDNILQGAGWSAPISKLFDYDTTLHAWVPKNTTTTFDHINPYTLMAYYCVYNEFFRDNNVDPSIPFEDMKNAKLSDLDQTLFNHLEALPVNKFHDRFTSGLISPQKSIAGISQVQLPLGTGAPVYAGAIHSVPAQNALHFANYAGNGNAQDGPLGTSSNGSSFVGASSFSGTYAVQPDNLWTDLSQASAASIDQLRIAFAIQELGELKAAFGSRMSSYYRGVWGIEVPDYILDRPEYLGGQRSSLSMVPVLNQANLLGEMAAHSRTTVGKYNSKKSFYEFGIWIKLACTRVHHTYSQGITNELLYMKDELDVYNRKFANLGNVAQVNKLIYNDWTSAQNEEVFNYNESWTDLRTDVSRAFGDFGPIHSDSSELYDQWSFQDIYTQLPVFSASWLKEDYTNVNRTMTGRLIPGATADYGHQYMVAFIRHDFATLPLPAHPVPAGLTNRI